jgi:hypothetical protein
MVKDCIRLQKQTISRSSTARCVEVGGSEDRRFRPVTATERSFLVFSHHHNSLSPHEPLMRFRRGSRSDTEPHYCSRLADPDSDIFSPEEFIVQTFIGLSEVIKC